MADANFAAGTVWTGDNLRILRGMNDACVDLVYLDPPFNSNRSYEAPIGSQAAGAAFKDAWTLDDVSTYEHGELADRHPAAYTVIEAARLTHGKGMQSYLIFMALRLLELRRVLKDSGSIYLHCDTTASHYLKLLMDAVFGRNNFRSDISWKRSSAHSDGRQGRQQHGRIHDVLLYYSNSQKWTWNSLHTPYDEDYIARFYRHVENGTGRRFRLDNLTGPGGIAKGNPQYEVMGVTRYWRYSREKMQKLIADGRVVQTAPGRVPAYKRYLDEMPGVPIQDLWTDILPVQSHSRERTGYPTQKPLALMNRIIEASSNPGDMVLDPFCGCATTLVAADRLQREWAGIDLSPLAIKLVNERIAAERGIWGGANALDAPPKRTDLGTLPNYRTHRHRLYGEQEGVCAGCATHFPFRVMEVDHILPKKKGGTDHADNLQLLCSGCNRAKGGRSMAEWRAAP